MKWSQEIREKAIALRAKGYFYSEICNELKYKIPKATLTYWFSHITLSSDTLLLLESKKVIAERIGQRAAVAANKQRRELYLALIKQRNMHLEGLLSDPIYGKVALAMLYLGEGRKSTKSGLLLGNSNPDILLIYIHLLKLCYKIDPNRLRARIQHRADQNPTLLLDYWSEAIGISKQHFYKPYLDKRTIGKPTLKTDYRGVCTVSYLSNELALDIITTINILMGR